MIEVQRLAWASDLIARTSYELRFGLASLAILALIFAPAIADEPWRPVLVDGFKTQWLVDLSTIRITDSGTEVWVKKVFDPEVMSEVFERYKVKASAYDVELWLLYPERRAAILQVIRYDSKGRTIEVFDYQSKGTPPAKSIPPGSSIEVLWKVMMRARGDSQDTK